MDIDWKKVLGTIAPGLATALGGPLAGIAVATVSDALLGRKDGSDADIATALVTGGPDAFTKLREADNAFKVKMRELDIDVERINQADRASAREREAKTADSFTPRALALLVTAGFFGVLAWLLAYGKPETGGDALLVMLGSLGTAWTAIGNYYFGSSAGSDAKTKMLAQK